MIAQMLHSGKYHQLSLHWSQPSPHRASVRNIKLHRLTLICSHMHCAVQRAGGVMMLGPTGAPPRDSMYVYKWPGQGISIVGPGQCR